MQTLHPRRLTSYCLRQDISRLLFATTISTMDISDISKGSNEATEPRNGELPPPANGSKRRENKKRKSKSHDQESAPAQRTRHEAGERGKAKSRPNLFVALQISSPDIHGRVVQFQRHVVSASPVLGEACVPVAKSHITLHVFRADESRLGELEAALKRAGAAATGGEPLQLRLRGVSNFRDRVVFAEIEDNATLTALYNEISTELSALDLLPEAKPLAAHMTLLKTSRAKSKEVLKAKILPDLYSDLQDLDFGVQVCTSLQLLSMVRPQGKEGYYFKHAEVPFAPSDGSRSREDHSLCCQQKQKNCFSSKPRKKEQADSKSAPTTSSRQVREAVRESVSSNFRPRSLPSNPSNPFVVMALCGITAIAAIKIFYAYRK